VIVDFHTHVFPPEVIASRERYLAADATFRELYSDPKAKLATAEDLPKERQTSVLRENLDKNGSGPHDGSSR